MAQRPVRKTSLPKPAIGPSVMWHRLAGCLPPSGPDLAATLQKVPFMRSLIMEIRERYSASVYGGAGSTSKVITRVGPQWYPCLREHHSFQGSNCQPDMPNLQQAPYQVRCYISRISALHDSY